MNILTRAWFSSTALLRSEDGKISFSKMVLTTLVAGWLFGRELEAALASVFLGAAYGYRGYRLYVAGKGPSE